jgi:hypothetical protein
MHFHGKTLFLDLYLLACTAAFLGYLKMRPSIARWRQRRVALLEDLFEPGTAELSGDELIRGHFNRPLIVGLFHGRPAAISTSPGLSGDILVSVSGHFYRPFEVRPKMPRVIDVLHRAINPFWWWLYGVVAFSNVARDSFEVPAWKAVVGMFLFPIAIYLVLFICSRLFGYDYVPGDTKGEISIANSRPLKYVTFQPDRVLSIINRPEIQSNCERLINGFQIDMLKSVSGIVSNRFLRNYGVGGTVQAKCVNRSKMLNRDTMRAMLTDLSVLCKNIEEADIESESLIPVAPGPL